MLFDEDDQRASRSLWIAFAWSAPALASQATESATLDLLAQVLHWEGLDVFVLAPAAGELLVTTLKAEPSRSRQLAARFGQPARIPQTLAERYRLLLGEKPALRPGRWDEADASGPGAWVAAPIAVEGRSEALLIVEGASLGPSAVRILEQFAALTGAVLARIRSTQALAQRIEASLRLQKTLVAEERLLVLGEAAAVLAHEMRNPLGTIHNAVALLERSSGAVDATPLTLIREEAERLDMLVRDLLQLARPLVPQRRPVDLAALTQETLTRLQGRIDRSDVRFQILTGPQLVRVSADASLLGLALENLLRNAAQASPRGGEVRVTLSTDADHALVVVEDQGPGIPAAHSAQIFEPFFTTRAVGTGLGLPIVKRVIEAHGGTVRAGSSPLGGARFELVLTRV